MKRPNHSLSILCLVGTFLLFPMVKAGKTTPSKATPTTRVASATTSFVAKAGALYKKLNLAALGLSQDAMNYAFRGQQVLASRGLLRNPGILTICDFSQSSSSKRMYIIDVKDERVLVNTYVAHGKNSGLQYAERFSNRPESLQSSLGFYVTKNTYFGKHGLSLRLSGKDRGFNDRAESRAVVVHGASYIGDQRLDAPYMGRSFGCPAVPAQVSNKVINLIKDGTCLFIYHPSKNYVQQSTVLNG